MNPTLFAQLSGLSVYRSLTVWDEAGQKPLNAMSELLRELHFGTDILVELYSNVFYTLATEGYDSMADYLNDHLRYDESPYGEAAARGTATPALEKAARHDLAVLSAVAALPCAELKAAMAAQLGEEWAEVVTALPEWNSGDIMTFEELTEFYQVNGCGKFARYNAFLFQNGDLHPVPNPDFMLTEAMWGYERQREQVIENTRALMDGKSVNNVLLYGKSGTGKSATVKAMLGMSEFEGLRLIEVPKDDLIGIPKLVRMLGHRPQKFIIFIDDLSFDKEDKTFSCLKSILEGGLEPRPANVAVYCTSNRRHLVRQNFSDRNGDEIDANETIQDKTSLAERFGLKILYSELSKPQFLQMAADLTSAQGLTLDPAIIQQEAVKWDIRYPSRSPRSANQFVASLLAKY